MREIWLKEIGREMLPAALLDRARATSLYRR
jgi:hypothetical protein